MKATSFPGRRSPPPPPDRRDTTQEVPRGRQEPSRQLGGLHADPLPSAAHEIVNHDAVGRGEQCVIAAAVDVQTGMDSGAALPDEDVPGSDTLTAEPLDSPALRLTVAAVAAGCAALPVGHAYGRSSS